MVYRGTITNGVARIIHCPPPQISTYYYITPVKSSYEAIKNGPLALWGTIY